MKLTGPAPKPGPRSRPFKEKNLHLFHVRSNVTVDGSSVRLTFHKEGQLKVTHARGRVIIGGAPAKNGDLLLLDEKITSGKHDWTLQSWLPGDVPVPRFTDTLQLLQFRETPNQVQLHISQHDNAVKTGIKAEVEVAVVLKQHIQHLNIPGVEVRAFLDGETGSASMDLALIGKERSRRVAVAMMWGVDVELMSNEWSLDKASKGQHDLFSPPANGSPKKAIDLHLDPEYGKLFLEVKETANGAYCCNDRNTHTGLMFGSLKDKAALIVLKSSDQRLGSEARFDIINTQHLDIPKDASVARGTSQAVQNTLKYWDLGREEFEAWHAKSMKLGNFEVCFLTIFLNLKKHPFTLTGPVPFSYRRKTKKVPNLQNSVTLAIVTDPVPLAVTRAQRETKKVQAQLEVTLATLKRKSEELESLKAEQ